MIKRILSCSALLAVAAFVASASAAGAPSVEQGKTLFSSTSLGTNGKSCSVCHPGGKGLEKSAAANAKALEKIVNQCIEKALKGKPLASGSPELSSLVLYLKTLGPAKTK